MNDAALGPEQREDRAKERQDDPRRDVEAGDGDIEDEEAIEVSRA